MKHYVWNPNGRAPRQVHHTQREADKEACRLASENRGEEFKVLKEVSTHLLPRQLVFGDLCVGEKFTHDGRILVKIEKVLHKDGFMERKEYNAVRLAPAHVAGRMSTFANTTAVERVS